MLLNVLFSDVPIEFTAAIIAIEMPAAMRPYSMAVAPLSSLMKRRTSFFICKPLRYLSHRGDTMRCWRFCEVNSADKNVDAGLADFPRV